MTERSAWSTPMPELPGAAPSVAPFVALTPIGTPHAARAALAAEGQTSVVDKAGMRRLWVVDLTLLVILLLVLLMVVQFVRDLSTGELGRTSPNPLPFIVLAASGSTLVPKALSRAMPAPGVIPSSPPARWRWHRRIRQDPSTAAPSGAWPAGAEAYALLSGAASVSSVAPSWLCERVGLTADVGAAWVASLRQRGWLFGGGRILGLAWLPELHLQITPAGRIALQAERVRITDLAAGWDPQEERQG